MLVLFIFSIFEMIALTVFHWHDVVVLS